ncbi:MAG: CBS domain-containing protein, partial [Cyanobacteria bacterium J083]
MFGKSLKRLLESRNLAKGSLDTRYALIEACAIGIFSALAALLLKEGIGWLGMWRIQAANYWGAKYTLPVVGMGLGMLAGWLIQQFSPEAAGGGIPQVKAVLAKVPLPLSLRVAVVKTIGTILVLGAGITLGRRGPTVHIGAALAAWLSNWLPTSPEYRRQMIAAGAAAGLAAGFNTPIAGVLFVVEELMRDISDLTLETAILASFTGAVVSRQMLGSNDLNLSVAGLNREILTSFTAQDIPFYLILGITSGLLGGLFNRGIIFSFNLSRRLHLNLAWRIGIVGLVSGTVIAFLPPVFQNNAGLRDSLISGSTSWQIIAIAFIVHFVLTLLAYGSGAPGGVFAPALVLGAALGYLVGTAEIFLLGSGSQYTLALAGMGAFFTAVVRVPVTAIVIVFEMNADFNLVLPLMIASAVAYIVAESVSKGSLYQHLLTAMGIELAEEGVRVDFLTSLTAEKVMKTNVETISSEMSLESLLQIMSTSTHHGFPVLEGDELVGIVVQSDIAKIANKQDNICVKQIMTPRPITVEPKTSLSDVLYILNRYQLSSVPVLEENKLVGIITHTDIIQAEARQLAGNPITKSLPSYVVYQTRSPAVGKGRILLALANPHHAVELFNIAAAIASQLNYELECLQILTVPKHTSPAQAKVNTVKSRRLMLKMERLSRSWNISLHTQVRVVQDKAEGILATIQARHINLMIMGWKNTNPTSEGIFGSLVDTLIDKAPCALMLVKLSTASYAYPHSQSHNKWLIPTAGGNNIKKAIELLPGIMSVSPQKPCLELCQIYTYGKGNRDLLKKLADKLQKQLNTKVEIKAIFAASVIKSLI